MLRMLFRRRLLVARSKACLPRRMLWMLVEKREYLQRSLLWSLKQFGLLWLRNGRTVFLPRWPLHRLFRVFQAHRLLHQRRVHVQGAFLLCCQAQRTPFWPLVLDLPGLRSQVGLLSLCLLLCHLFSLRLQVRRCPFLARQARTIFTPPRDSDRPAVSSPVGSFIVGPRFSHVPAKLVAQIVAGKYVDLSELLAVNLVQKDPEPQLLLDGRLVLTSQPKKQRRRIEDIASWMEAIAIFSLTFASPSMSVFSSASAYNLPTGATRDVADRPAVLASPVVDQPFIVGPGFSSRAEAKLVAQIVCSVCSSSSFVLYQRVL